MGASGTLGGTGDCKEVGRRLELTRECREFKKKWNTLRGVNTEEKRDGGKTVENDGIGGRSGMSTSVCLSVTMCASTRRVC